MQHGEPLLLSVVITWLFRTELALVDILANPLGTKSEGSLFCVSHCKVLEDRAVQIPTVRKRNLFSEWTITADDAEQRLARALWICVGNELRKMYGDVPKEPIPSKIANLLHRLGY